MSTRNALERREPGERWPASANDPAEQLALLAAGRRELLLHVHRWRLRREDLEDCYSQATLELIVRVREGRRFAGQAHMANAIEQRFLSRVDDRRRALSGRSPMQAALETAIRVGDELADGTHVEIIAPEIGTEDFVILRNELRRLRTLAERLSVDQRRALACQLAGVTGEVACRRYGWSAEKYRKVAQRARTSLRRLMAEEESADVPCGRSSS